MKMQKYKVVFPQPKAKRLTKRKIILFKCTCGFSGGGHTAEYEIPPNEPYGEFYVEEDMPHIGSRNGELDGLYFTIEMEFSNESGSRKEIIELIPEKIED